MPNIVVWMVTVSIISIITIVISVSIHIHIIYIHGIIDGVSVNIAHL